MLPEQIDEVLLSEKIIQSRVAEMGRTLTQDYADSDLVIVGVLRGCFVFLADLIRHLDIPLEVETIAVMSYGDATKSSGHVRTMMDLQKDIQGRDVLVVEDVVDTGRTITYLLRTLAQRGPKSLRVCTLLDKPSRREVPVDPDYTGFEIPDRFVVGYGLDFAQKYRNLPYIGILREPLSFDDSQIALPLSLQGEAETPADAASEAKVEDSE